MKNKVLIIATLVLFSMSFSSCEDENENENETKISSYTSSESHNAGENCMECHKSGGSGEGWFTVAGTVYHTNLTSIYPGATIKLYTEPNEPGSLIATVEVDQKGNFYTTKKVDFGNGLYAAAEGNTTTKHMSGKVTTGACNSCHGVNKDPIWTE